MTDTTLVATSGVAISLLALDVSAVTMYFAWLRRGRLIFGAGGKADEPPTFLA
jgi:hypothetical protein